MLGPITYRFSESDKSFLFFVIFTLVFLDENRVIFLQSDPPGNVKISGYSSRPTIKLQRKSTFTRENPEPWLRRNTE